MWKIIKAEYRYSWKTLFFVTASILAGTFFYNSISPASGLQALLFPPVVVIIIQPLMLSILEKRERQQALLPVSLHHVAIARLFMVVFPAAVIYCGYIIYLFITASPDRVMLSRVLDSLMFFGMILFAFSSFLIVRDLALYFRKKQLAVEIQTGLMIVLLISFLAGIPLALAILKDVKYQIFLQVLCFIAGFACLYGARISFERRHSYIE